ncbi:MAG: DNA alkylation repair protein [Propionibacteriaceae bacterium]|jgi:3-methyladenine DNA glycosylase AlkD|nr:DNA alkylation repair protein [Propionibacteriaceae bacterium]
MTVREIGTYEILERFSAAADPVKAQPMKAYMRDQFEFLGIPKPQRALLSREFLNQAGRSARIRGSEGIDWDFVDLCWEKPQREFQYLAISYLMKFKQVIVPSDLPKIQQLIVTKSWWDTVDALDLLVGAIALRHKEMNEILLIWSRDDNIWLRRTAIDHQLDRKADTDAELLATIIIANLGQTEFFINKAIGWSLREYSKTNPDWVRTFINEHREKMASLSIREASKYL